MSQLNVRYYQSLREISTPSWRCAVPSVGASWKTHETELLPEPQTNE